MRARPAAKRGPCSSSSLSILVSFWMRSGRLMSAWYPRLVCRSIDTTSTADTRTTASWWSMRTDSWSSRSTARSCLPAVMSHPVLTSFARHSRPRTTIMVATWLGVLSWAVAMMKKTWVTIFAHRCESSRSFAITAALRDRTVSLSEIEQLRTRRTPLGEHILDMRWWEWQRLSMALSAAPWRNGSFGFLSPPRRHRNTPAALTGFLASAASLSCAFIHDRGPLASLLSSSFSSPASSSTFR
mmetsp:Transcript_11659/g.36996  ORF Transcript_11659/g.36996 Transcript_11659/m.36996 type:complete len:242 (-) Transcript_11659:2540-3265(-)